MFLRCVLLSPPPAVRRADWSPCFSPPSPACVCVFVSCRRVPLCVPSCRCCPVLSVPLAWNRPRRAAPAPPCSLATCACASRSPHTNRVRGRWCDTDALRLRADRCTASRTTVPMGAGHRETTRGDTHSVRTAAHSDWRKGAQRDLDRCISIDATKGDRTAKATENDVRDRTATGSNAGLGVEAGRDAAEATQRSVSIAARRSAVRRTAQKTEAGGAHKTARVHFKEARG